MTIPNYFQIVKYTADPYGYGGYVADVKYEGYAKYPDHKPAYHPAPKRTKQTIAKKKNQPKQATSKSKPSQKYKDIKVFLVRK